jgi:hypothetical protein
MAGFNNQQQGFSSPKLHQSSSSNSIKASGLATSKVIYKRRRASRRVPTTILETSCQEFRDAVQKLTGFHRPTPSAASAKQLPSKPRASMAPMPSSYEVDDEHVHHPHHDYEDDAAQVAAQEQSSSPSPSPQSVLSDPGSSEMPHGEFFHHFLRESIGSPRKHEAAASAAPTSRGVPPIFAAFANMPAQLRAAYRQPSVGPNAALFGAAAGRGALPPFWEDAFGSADFMASLAKLQDPSMAPNPYLIALENQLLAKFARRMQMAASNPLEHPWYQMDHMAPLRA